MTTSTPRKPVRKTSPAKKRTCAAAKEPAQKTTPKVNSRVEFCTAHSSMVRQQPPRQQPWNRNRGLARLLPRIAFPARSVVPVLASRADLLAAEIQSQLIVMVLNLHPAINGSDRCRTCGASARLELRGAGEPNHDGESEQQIDFLHLEHLILSARTSAARRPYRNPSRNGRSSTPPIAPTQFGRHGCPKTASTL